MAYGHDLVLSCVEIVTSTEPRTGSEGTAKVPGYEDRHLFFVIIFFKPFVKQ